MRAYRVKVQRFGRFLSNMVMPNIGAFIAWGIITALFIPTGWIPHQTLASLVGPMITYLLPLLIGYQGGKLIFGERGAVVGSLATIGVVVGSDIPMFLGAMIAGPVGGMSIKKFDAMVKGKIKSGFEMLVNNFSVGIIGGMLALLFFSVIGQMVNALSLYLASGVNFLVSYHLLPLTSVLVEVAKILFLNNAINHGVFSPLGIVQSQEFGKSIFFLLEANPGPGLGVLLAYMLVGKGSARQTAAPASVIHFLGGIHEIYFPYVLMYPRLILAAILGGMTGVFTLVVFDAGLIAPASPGSIIAIIAMTPSSSLIGVISSVLLATVVSFVVSALLLSGQQESRGSLDEAKAHLAELKEAKILPNRLLSIVVACDAGMGSSAMGAAMLNKKLISQGIAGVVNHCAIEDIDHDADVVITHKDLTARAKEKAPWAEHFSLSNFLDQHFYDDFVAMLKQSSADVRLADQTEQKKGRINLPQEHIFLGLKAEHKDEVIRFIGEKMKDLGLVTEYYVEQMREREMHSSTYIGEEIAIPHGTHQGKREVINTGIIVCQYPQGVVWGDDGELVRLVIGIAATDNEHLAIINALALNLDDPTHLAMLKTTRDKEPMIKTLAR